MLMLDLNLSRSCSQPKLRLNQSKLHAALNRKHMGICLCKYQSFVLMQFIWACFSVVLSTLRQLCTTTSILSDPSVLPEEAIQAVTQTNS